MWISLGRRAIKSSELLPHYYALILQDYKRFHLLTTFLNKGPIKRSSEEGADFRILLAAYLASYSSCYDLVVHTTLPRS